MDPRIREDDGVDALIQASIIRGSSNGRTTGSGPVYWGSNPYPRAVKQNYGIKKIEPY